MRKPLFGKEVERQCDPGWITDSTRSFSQGAQVMIRVLTGRRLEQLRREPEHPLRFVGGH